MFNKFVLGTFRSTSNFQPEIYLLKLDVIKSENAILYSDILYKADPDPGPDIQKKWIPDL